MRGVFVTGTGTGVGKTVVAAVIARGLAGQGRSVAVLKPALTGLDEGGEPDHLILKRASGSQQSPEQIAPYRFGPPVSPHLAAHLAGSAIEPAELIDAARRAAEGAEVLVCEGVGGFLVPLTPGYLVRDFARELGLGVVIAASPELGTINHTLLTVEAVRAVGLPVLCVVLTPWPAEPAPIHASNLEAIESLGGVAAATLGRIDLADPARWPAPPDPVLGELGGE